MKTTKDAVATLTVNEFPSAKRERERLARWLNDVADTIAEAKPSQYAEIARFRLMK